MRHEDLFSVSQKEEKVFLTKGGFLMYRFISMQVTAAILVLALLPAGEAAERVVSLGEAIALSLEGNHELRAAGNGLAAKHEDVGIARSLLLPRLSFEERFMRTANPTYAFMAKLNQERFTQQDFAIDSLNSPRPVNDFQTAVLFEQAVFVPKAFIGLDMAREDFRARGEEYDRKREETVYAVFRAYCGVQTSRVYVTVAEKAVEDAAEHRRIAEVRYDSGLGLYSDSLRADVALTEAEERLVTARKNLEVARRGLGLLLGLAESVDVKEDRPSLAVRDLEYYYQASQARKDLLSVEARYRNAENSLKLANAGYLPMVGVGGSYQLNDHRRPFGSEGDSWQVTAFLRWELFDGTKREHERRKARSVIAEAGEYREGLRKYISFQVYESYLAVEEARKGLELARKASQSAEEGRRLVRARYENSLSTIVDLLDVQTALDAARANVAAKEGAYLTAVANLGFQSGTIMKDLDREMTGGIR